MSLRKSRSSAPSRPQPATEFADSHHREALRRKFLPSDLWLLFIGESPPASGRFFYRADSGLYRAMRDAFRAVDPSINDRNFLETFQASGCYLVDLCPYPVDHLDRKLRADICRASEGLLSTKIAHLQPRMIASVVRSIEGNILRATSAAKWHGPLIRLPYPGRWSHCRKVFLNTLIPKLAEGGARLSPRT